MTTGRINQVTNLGKHRQGSHFENETPSPWIQKKFRFNSNFDGQKTVRQPSDFPFRVVKALESTRELELHREREARQGTKTFRGELCSLGVVASATKTSFRAVGGVVSCKDGKSQLEPGPASRRAVVHWAPLAVSIVALYSPHVRATCSGGVHKFSTTCYVLVCCITALSRRAHFVLS